MGHGRSLFVEACYLCLATCGLVIQPEKARQDSSPRVLVDELDRLAGSLECVAAVVGLPDLLEGLFEQHGVVFRPKRYGKLKHRLLQR